MGNLNSSRWIRETEIEGNGRTRTMGVRRDEITVTNWRLGNRPRRKVSWKVFVDGEYVRTFQRKGAAVRVYDRALERLRLTGKTSWDYRLASCLADAARETAVSHFALTIGRMPDDSKADQDAVARLANQAYWNAREAL